MKHQNLIRKKRTLHREPTIEEYSAAYEIDFSDDPEPEPKPQPVSAPPNQTRPQPASEPQNQSQPLPASAPPNQSQPQPAPESKTGADAAYTPTGTEKAQPASESKTGPSAAMNNRRAATHGGRKALIAAAAGACLLLVLFFFFRNNSSSTPGSPAVESQQADAAAGSTEENSAAGSVDTGEAQNNEAETEELSDEEEEQVPKDEDETAEASAAASLVREITIPEPDYEDLNVDGVYVGSRFVIDEKEPIIYTGSISSGDHTDIYHFTGAIDGWYSFRLESSKQNSLDIIVLDSNDTKLIDSHTGRTIELIAGEEYTIEVSQYSEPSDYTLRIDQQTVPWDITEITTLEDQFSFEGQENYYFYTAPRDGYYRFELTQMNANMRVNTVIRDRFDNKLRDSLSNGFVELEEGETYTVRLQQYDGLGSYTMLVYTQKPTQDITGYGAVNDSIQYNDQSNYYTFTAPVDGYYRFAITDQKADTRFAIVVRDQYESKLMDVYSGGNVSMEAGETYSIEVQQSIGLGSYKLQIGYQKETVDISDADIVYDSITFANQTNEYLYTPSETRDYTLTLGEYLSSCRFDLIVLDKYDYKLMNVYGSGTVTLEADQTYRIQVGQSSDYSSYSLSIQ